ncbi:unnamed protein product [Lampetra planeri]
MATKRSGVVSQEAEDGAMRRPGGGRPAEERDEARASTSRRAEEDAWWQRARKGEEPTRSGMVSASPGEEAEEAPSSAGLQAQGAQSDAVQASPGPVGAGRPQERAGRWRGGSAGNFTPLHAKRHNCVRVSFKEDVPEEVTIDRPRSRVADGEGEVAEDGLKPTQPGGKMEDGGGEVGRQGTPLQDEREEGEMTSEEDADPTGRQVEHPGDKDEEAVEKPPDPTVVDWAEAVEAGEDGEEQQRESTRREKFKRVVKRKQKAPRGPARSTRKRDLEATDSSIDARSSEDGAVAAKTNQGRGLPKEPRRGEQLQGLADTNLYELLDDGSGQRAGGVWAQAWAVIGAVKEALWMARQKLIKGAYMSPPEVCRLARGLLERVVEVERATTGGGATGAKWRWPLPKCGMG